ncbi:phospholipase D-like domain-containing protein [Nocardia mexicana]|uniref:Phospholipase D-like protein n=1 Tax=Nocardia mexicana TaxID=279262 RepID=A0A370H5G0_9NOCA|nr:phospholipase D-like domain-containing protein [Nocardia mexicana]RDI49306.1 phospholipase D-like protein [Nocardia mexicana]
MQGPVGPAAPHLDAVEAKLREVSPGLEGETWQRTHGNELSRASGDPAGWLLQNPGCWGDPKCVRRPGTERLLDRTLEHVSRATRTVDISSLEPFPDGTFLDTLVAGLHAATAAGHHLKMRVLVGGPVSLGAANDPVKFRDILVDRLGGAASDVDLTVATTATDDPALSWNHSKLVVVDGITVIAGGINQWAGDYLDPPDPVIDVDLALRGPAAAPAGRFLDGLWSWVCEHRGIDTGSAGPLPGLATGSSGGSSGFGPSLGYSVVATSEGADCLPRLEQDSNPEPDPVPGGVPVIAVGGRGVSLGRGDKSSDYDPRRPDAEAAGCFGAANLGHDYFNDDREYDTANPDSSAQRALVASAQRHIEISQQDLLGPCPLFTKYDVRLFDILAAKLASGVKVRIVVSDPANHFPPGGYSNMGSLSDLSDVLLERLRLRTGGDDSARTAMCKNLQLASVRAADAPTWDGGKHYRQHTKLISVDRAAFYIGSKNLYPAYLQEFGYIVESPKAAAQLDADLLAPQWKYSQATANVDYAKGACPR